MNPADDVAVLALRAAIAGDTTDAFIILTKHVRQADDPTQVMFVIAAGYAAVAHDEVLSVLSATDRMPADDADLVRTMVSAVRSDDLVGAWLLWQTVTAGSAGAVLGGLLAVAALSARLEAGL